MNKKEFQDTFKILVDGLTERVSTLGIPNIIRPYFKPETVQKWYDGISVPANITREMVISYLHSEQEKRKSDDTIKEFIKDNLQLDIENNFYCDSHSVTINLKLCSKTISSIDFNLKDLT